MPSYTTNFSLKTFQINFLDSGVDATAYFAKTLTNDDDPEDFSVVPGMSIQLTLSDEILAKVTALATDTHQEKVAEIAAARAAAKTETLARTALVGDNLDRVT